MYLAVACVLLGLSQVSFGVPIDMSLIQPYDAYAIGMFYAEDLDGNGIISITELYTLFDRYDNNNDGRESRQEYTTYICSFAPELYQLSHYLYDDWDFDGDHHLDHSDYDQLFAVMDADNDGGVVEAEFVAYFVALFTSIEGQGNHQHGNSFEHGAHACHVK